MIRKAITEGIDKLSGSCGLAIHDLETGETVLNNENEVFPSASIIKLFILWELFRRVDTGEINLCQEIVLQESDKVGGFGILKELHAGLKVTYRDLALLMIVLSDNVATNILIDTLGMANINATIQQQGFLHTTLQRKMMDGKAKEQGLDNYTTAYDVMMLLMDLEQQAATLSSASRQQFIDILKRQQCNNKLPMLLPPGTILAHKTGDLPQVEHDAGIMYVKDKPVVVVVLTKDLVNNLEGVKFNNVIGKIVYDYFSSRRVHSAEK